MKGIAEIFEAVIHGYFGKLFLLGLIFALFAVAVVLYQENPERFRTTQDVSSLEQESEKGAEEIDTEESKAAEFYADSVCLLSDPGYWQGILDRNAQAYTSADFTVAHGYSNQQEAEADVLTYKDRGSFRTQIKRLVNSRCQAAFQASGVDIDEQLDNAR